MGSGSKYFLALASGVATAVASADDEGVFSAAEYGAAREMAAAEKRGIALLFVDDSKRCEAVESIAIPRLREHSVVLMMNYEGREELEMAPPVITALYTSGIEFSSPRVAVTSPDLTEVYAGASAKQLFSVDRKKTLAAIEKEVVAKLLDWDPDAFYEDHCKVVHWWGLKGRKNYKGKFKRLGTAHLYLTKPDGGEQRVPFDRMTPATLAFARELARFQLAASFETETWTSSDGKELQARFVSLDDAGVVLELEGGKRVTVPGGRLDTASQERAIDYAAKLKKVAG